jgi:flagellar motility protein MotE (MotC chaperone)
MNFFSKFRFLPVTIFVASMLLTVKIGDIWTSVDGLKKDAIQVAGAEAQTETPPPAPENPPAAAQPGVPPAPTAAPAGQQAAVPGAADPNAAAAPPPGDPAQSKLITDDPTLLTPQEIDLLQRLSDRRREIEAREQELKVRLGLLTAAEARIDRKIAELKNLQGEIESRIKVFDEQQEKKMESLVKIYENMKPKDAARIFEDLEMDTLLEVAQRMKERKLAPVMAKMNPEKAREVTVELRDLEALPRQGLDQGN